LKPPEITCRSLRFKYGCVFPIEAPESLFEVPGHLRNTFKKRIDESET